jgi:hypothetical protein
VTRSRFCRGENWRHWGLWQWFMGGGGSGLSRLDRGASNVRLDAAIRNGPGSVRVVAVLVDDYSSHVQLDSVATGLCFG